MKLWLISRQHYGYDEYDSFVIRAEDAVGALKLAQEKEDDDDPWHAPFGMKLADHYTDTERFESDETVKVEEIALDGDAEIILGSYNAG